MNSLNLADELKEINRKIETKEALVEELEIKLLPPKDKDGPLNVKLKNAKLSLDDHKARLALYDKSITSAPQSSKST